MWMLPAALRARIAMITLLGVLLIPVTTSSLRGLTHVVSCRDAVDTTLSVDASTTDDAVLGSAGSVTRDAVTLCDGLAVDLELASTSEDRADVVVTVINHTDRDWRGTVELRVAGVDVPVAIGSVAARDTATDTVTLRVQPGQTYEISGTLLVGP